MYQFTKLVEWICLVVACLFYFNDNNSDAFVYFLLMSIYFKLHAQEIKK